MKLIQALKKIKALEAQTEELRTANATVEQTVGHWAIEATAAIEAAAARLEQTVQTLNGAGRTEG